MYYNDFYKLIISKQIDFIEKYGTPPRFIKVPSYYSDGLFDNQNNILDFAYFEGIAGLIICETPTVKELKDCEVF